MSFDPAFAAVAIDLTGEITDQSGDLDSTPIIDVRQLDGTNDLLRETEFLTSVASDNSFDEILFFPLDVAAIDLAVRVGSFDNGRTWHRLSGLSSGVNVETFTYDHNPPAVTLTGAFTENGQRITGVRTFDVEVEYLDPNGFTRSLAFQRSAFLSIVDGSYELPVELPAAVTAVEFTARVGPDPAKYPSVVVASPLPGPSGIDFTVDLDQPVDVALTAMLSVDAAPFGDPTEIEYRAFDARGVEVVEADTLSVDPDPGGLVADTLQFPTQTRRVEFAWTATDGPTYESFDVSPGANAIDLDLDVEPVLIQVSGSLTDNGAPVTTATTFDLTYRPTPSQVLGTEDVVVTPESNGDFSFTVTAPATTKRFDLLWEDGNVAAVDRFDVQPGTNPIDFNRDTTSYQSQRIVVQGAVTVDGAPWPSPVDFTLRLRRVVGGSQITVPFTVTPDAGDGSYSFEYLATQGISSVFVQAEVDSYPNVTENDVAVDGDTTIDLDVPISGRLIQVTGNVVDGASVPGFALVAVFDPATNEYFETGVFPDGSGDFDVEILVPGSPTEVSLGMASGHFDADTVVGTPISLTAPVTSVLLSDDLAASSVQVTGTILEDSAARTDPFPVIVTWFDDDVLIEPNWTSTVEVTPNGSGVIDETIRGPRRADRAVVVAALPTDQASVTASIDPLVAGVNAVDLTASYSTGTLDLSGALDVSFDVPVAIESFDASDDSLGVITTEVAEDGSTGAYTASLTVPSSAARFEVVADLGRLAYWTDDSHDGLVFRQSIPATGTATAATFDLAETPIEITGIVTTSAGELRADESFNYSLVAYAGGVNGVEIGAMTGDGFTGGSGESFVEDYLPAGTDTVVLTTDFAGTTPITLTGFTPGGPNDIVADITTSPFDVVTVSGRLAVDGLLPRPFSARQVSLTARRTIASQAIEFWSTDVDYNYSGSSGVGSKTLLVPPEADDVVFSAIFFDGSGTEHVVTLDLTSGPGPYSLPIDIDD